MMRRSFALLPLLGAATCLLPVGQAVSQEKEPFGVLTTPAAAAAAPKGAAGLPRGMEPATPAPNSPPVNLYPVPSNAGEWMICAASYVGPDGASLAKQVCEYLREKRLSAFIYNRGQEERLRVQKEWEEFQKQRPGMQMRRRTVRVQDQYAVLVGGFRDFEHASNYLPQVRKLPVPKLKLEGGRNPYEVMTYQDEAASEKGKAVMKSALMSPFHNALVVRNPKLPPAGRQKWDPIWKTLNEDEEYSLLKNQKPWTLIVKEYVGGRVVQQRGNSGSGSSGSGGGGLMGALGLGGAKEGEMLEGAAQQAHELARFLNSLKLGYRAYVLHTRYSSAVFVGGFDSPQDPEMVKAAERVKKLTFSAGQAKGGNVSVGADLIGLMPQPLGVEVPKF